MVSLSLSVSDMIRVCVFICYSNTLPPPPPMWNVLISGPAVMWREWFLCCFWRRMGQCWKRWGYISVIVSNLKDIPSYYDRLSPSMLMHFISPGSSLTIEIKCQLRPLQAERTSFHITKIRNSASIHLRKQQDWKGNHEQIHYLSISFLPPLNL